MEHRAFGNTGLTVSVIGMGTWQTYDVRGAEADARHAVTDAALEMGATFFDSSPMYGQAEQVLGRTLEGRRDGALIATKVWAANDAEADQRIDAALGYFDGRVDVCPVRNLLAAPVVRTGRARVRPQARHGTTEEPGDERVLRIRPYALRSRVTAPRRRRVAFLT